MENHLSVLFDPYSRQARLYPALLTILPPLLLLLAWHPELLTSDLGTTLLTLGASCGLLYALSSWARTKGKKVEQRLLRDWGGWPTTHRLRHSGPTDQNTLRRYHLFLNRNIPHLTLPSAGEEAASMNDADAAYSSAVFWLKEQTRGRNFPLIAKENAQYGFRRNLRGVRNTAVFLCITAIYASLTALIIANYGASTPSRILWVDNLLEAIEKAPGPVIGAMLICMASVMLWLSVVRDDWVREGAEQYARALLAACDRL